MITKLIPWSIKRRIVWEFLDLVDKKAFITALHENKDHKVVFEELIERWISYNKPAQTEGEK